MLEMCDFDLFCVFLFFFTFERRKKIETKEKENKMYFVLDFFCLNLKYDFC